MTLLDTNERYYHKESEAVETAGYLSDDDYDARVVQVGNLFRVDVYERGTDFLISKGA